MNPEGQSVPSAAVVRAEVLVLLREKRYEEALAMLYRARSESPGSAEIQKSIDQIKEFLIGAYAKRLGGLDLVAKPIPTTAVRSPDAVLLSRYIDGVSTYGDIAQMSPLGQLRTLQVLVGLYAPSKVQPSIDSGPPRSGRRESERPSGAVEVADSAPPNTERSPLASRRPAAESDEDRRYREQFASGTAAFVQLRFEDAVQAFEDCARLRPGDAAATVMLKRSLRDLESR